MTDLRAKAEFRRKYVYPLWNESQVTPYEAAMDIMERHLMAYGEEVRRETLEEAANLCREKASAMLDEFNNTKSSYEEGICDGAGDLEDAIRALAQPKKEATDAG